MIYAIKCISILGSIVWLHHIYTVTLHIDTISYFIIVTMGISLPTGSKLYNWICTIGNLTYSICYQSISILFTLVFTLFILIGGCTGIILGNVLIDIYLHDSYYVITHFHFILSLGTGLTIILSIFMLQDHLLHYIIITYTSILSRYYSLHLFIGILSTFTSMHYLGFNIMPRRIFDTPDSNNSWNYISSIGSGITLISFFIVMTE